MATRRSSVFGQTKIDTTELREFVKSIKNGVKHVQHALQVIQPEFGAYMSYSLYLEEGTRKMAARPHIKVAVLASKGAIVKEQAAALTKMMGTKNLSAAGAEQIMKTAWIRALNGPTRQYAVALATSLGVVQYGFHRRSIGGYAYKRSPGEILAVQQSAMAQRAGLAKKAKKATGGKKK